MARQAIDRVRSRLSLGMDSQVISKLKTRLFYYLTFDQGEAGIPVPRWLMSITVDPWTGGDREIE